VDEYRMATDDETITNILKQNRLHDLKRFLQRRQCLNGANTGLVYLFHLVQSAGILLSSYAAGTNNTNWAWAGITLNVAATLIHSYEKTNNTILGKLMTDIDRIRDGTYVDEGILIDTRDEKKPSTSIDAV
jgi:hypothetical protein